MNRANRKSWCFILTIFFFSILACQRYDRLDSDIVEKDDLSGRSFAYAELIGRDLSHKNLRNANFTRANLEGADLSNSDLTGATFNRTILFRANFTGATLDERWLPIIDLLTTHNGAGQDFQGLDLSNTYLPAGNLAEANLRGANLSGSFLAGANLRHADLTGADLRGADLYGANLRYADLTDALLNRSTTLRYATFTGATVSLNQLRNTGISCTRLPDGSIYDESTCAEGRPPLP
jgi:uncharacterized protein YjbI with pentapeptide repeats